MADDNKFWGDVEEEPMKEPLARLEVFSIEGITRGLEYSAAKLWFDFIEETDAEFFGETKNTIIGVECLKLNIQSSIQALTGLGRGNETGDLSFSPTSITEMNRQDEEEGGPGNHLHIRLDNYIGLKDLETDLEKDLYTKLGEALQYANHNLEYLECLLIFYMVLERCNNFDINEHQGREDEDGFNEGDETDV
jgi:hypothetical protein